LPPLLIQESARFRLWEGVNLERNGRAVGFSVSPLLFYFALFVDEAFLV
jgi:hypothetical protein